MIKYRPALRLIYEVQNLWNRAVPHKKYQTSHDAMYPGLCKMAVWYGCSSKTARVGLFFRLFIKLFQRQKRVIIAKNITSTLISVNFCSFFLYWGGPFFGTKTLKNLKKCISYSCLGNSEIKKPFFALCYWWYLLTWYHFIKNLSFPQNRFHPEHVLNSNLTI